MRVAVLAIMAMLFAQQAHAAESSATIESAVFIEHREQAGERMRVVRPASTFGPGDKVVTILEWKAAPENKPAVVSMAVPRHLAFQRSSADSEEVSVDGGRSWGKLGTLTVRDAYGWRLASPEDVTNLRWRVRGPNGRIAYSALVR